MRKMSPSLPVSPHVFKARRGCCTLASVLEGRMEGRYKSPIIFQRQLACFQQNDRSMNKSNSNNDNSSNNNVNNETIRWSLSPNKQIYSLDRCMESLDVHASECSRYLLTGSIDGILSVYDLSKVGAEKTTAATITSSLFSSSFFSANNNIVPIAVHKPVARSSATPLLENEPTRLGSVIRAQWYPIDTGAFISAHATGAVCVWDTNKMALVARMNPFAFEKSGSRPGRFPRQDDSSSNPLLSLSCMDLSLHHDGTLVATGSWNSPLVKLVDIRSGASSHTLTGHPRNSSGITTVQWSPTAPHVLASGCTHGCVRLWDIRKAGRHSWLLDKCLDPHQPPPSRYVSKAYYPDLRHLKEEQAPAAPATLQPLQRNYKKTNVCKTAHTARAASTAAFSSINDYSHSASASLVRSHDAAVDALAFDPSGQYLVSHGKGENTLKVWDLRDAAQLVPRRYPVSARAKYTKIQVAPSNSFRSDYNDMDPIIVDNHCMMMIHVAQDLQLSAYSFHHGGPAQYQLNGHLKPIRDFSVITPSHAASTRGEILTAAADGLILSWQPTVVHRKDKSNNKYNRDFVATSLSSTTSSSKNDGGCRKRHRTSLDGPFLVDEDTW